MTLTTRPTCRSAAVFGPLLLAGIMLAAATPAEAQQIVMVIDPPSVETNRFWATSGDFGLNPAMQPLVGQDPETGAYDASGLARS